MSRGGAFDPIAAVCGLSPHHRPCVVLAPDPTGWFGGTSVVASDPGEVFEDISVAAAAAHLEAAFSDEGFSVAAALIPYEGPARVHVYSSAFLREAGTWSVRGEPQLDPHAVRSQRPAQRLPGPLMRSIEAEMDAEAFGRRVLHTESSIAAGDVYVLNLTYRVRGVPSGPPGRAFAELIRRAPASMQALFAGPHNSVASASPERFLSIERDAVGVRTARIQPVKGTAPRGRGRRDRQNVRALVGSEKERAEHIMIVDLERNDLGRVCVPGTVLADPLLEVVTTPYCHQMVSTVSGTLRPDASIADVLAATFPCGSVTGAPKLAAMRHIAELETSRRGAYTGALVVAMPGRLDSSVLIRTLEYRDGAGQWGTGCGITIDSDPVAEWDESVLKTWPLTGG